MRFNCLIKIAILKLKDRKSIHNIIAMAIGMSIIIPIVWLLLSFNMGIVNEINQVPINNILSFESSLLDAIYLDGDNSVYAYNYYRGQQLSDMEYNYFKNDSEVAWREFLIKKNPNNTLDMVLGNDEIKSNEDLSFKFLMSNNDVLKGMQDYIYSNYNHDAIYGKKFTDKKREIYVSEKWLEKMGYSTSEVSGKKISLSISYFNYDLKESRYLLDNDNIVTNKHIMMIDKDYDLGKLTAKVKIFENFEIVGIISNEYYELNQFTSKEADFWLRADVLTDNQGTSLFPEISMQDLYIDGNLTFKVIATYANEDFLDYSQIVTSQGCFFPFIVGNDYLFTRNSGEMVLPLRLSYVQYNDFNETKEKIGYFNALNNVADGSGYRICTLAMESLIEDYKIAITISGIVGIIGVVSLLSILVNYSQYLNFNVRKRLQYFEVLHRIGITQREKYFIFFIEILVEFLIASLLSCIISLTACLIIKGIFSLIFKNYSMLNLLQMKIHFFAPAYLLIFSLTGVIVMILALISMRTLNGVKSLIIK